MKFLYYYFTEYKVSLLRAIKFIGDKSFLSQFTTLLSRIKIWYYAIPKKKEQTHLSRIGQHISLRGFSVFYTGANQVY